MTSEKKDVSLAARLIALRAEFVRLSSVMAIEAREQPDLERRLYCDGKSMAFRHAAMKVEDVLAALEIPHD